MDLPVLDPSVAHLASSAKKSVLWSMGAVSAAGLAWLGSRDFSGSNGLFHPHGYCYLWMADLVGAHVVSDALIFLSYLTISLTLLHLVRQTRREIPFSWMFLAFGSFIVACGATHAMEIVTLWKPLFWLAADVKIVTAAASIVAAVALPPLVPRVVRMVADAHVSESRRVALEQANRDLEADIIDRKALQDRLQASVREKELLLKEVHHRVKNNLAVISSLLYLQSTYTQDVAVIGVFEESQRRVRSMALVHERLYGSQNLSELDFGEYARVLTEGLESTHGFAHGEIRIELDVQPLPMSIDLAVPCGLILNELLSNALKHAFVDGRPGTITVSVRRGDDGLGVLQVTDDGVGLPGELNLETHASLGMRLIRSLVRQIDGAFDLLPASPGTDAHLTFPLSQPHVDTL
jgi:two-component sensor histidine kinase